MRFCPALVFVIFAGGCRTGRCSFSVEALMLRASVNEGEVAVVSFANVGSSGLLLARTHGVSAQGLQLDIQTADGHTIGYPNSMPEMTLIGSPATFCLDPGDVYDWRVPMRAFAIEYGGSASESRYAFDLPRGNYRLRAIYRDRCMSEPCGEVRSDWTLFSVE